MRTLARARHFQCNRHAQLTTRFREALRILAPLGIVEVDGQEVAGVVGEQRVDAGGVPPGKVIKDRPVGQRDQAAVATV